MKKPRTSNRIWIKIALPSLFALATFFLAFFRGYIPALETSLLEEKKQSIQNLTQGAIGSLTILQNLEAQGVLTREQAQQEAVALIKDIRFGPEKKDYFWINDLYPRMIMHPYRPDLNGTDLTGYADPNGLHVFVEFVQASKNPDGAFVDYFWQFKDDPLTVLPKLSFVKRFEPWGWVVGTGVYLDEVEQQTAEAASHFAHLAVGAMVLIAILLGYGAWHGILATHRAALQEKRYRTLVKNAPIGIFSSTPEGRYIDANPALARMFGYDSPEDLMTKVSDITELYADKKQRARLLKRLETRGELIDRLSPRLRKNGERFWTVLNVRAVRTQEGAISHFEGFTLDVTPRIHAQQRLRETVAELESIFKNSHVGIMLLKGYRILARGNQRLADILGYESPGEMLGMSMRQLHLSETKFLEYGKRYYDTLQQGEQTNVEWQLRRKDGSAVWCELSGKAVDDSEPADLSKGVIWILNDITPRKTAEIALQNAFESFQKVLDALDAHIYVADLETHEVLFMNRNMRDDFGDCTAALCHRSFWNNDVKGSHSSGKNLLDEDGNPAGIVQWEDRNPVTGRYYLNKDRAMRWVDGRLVHLQVAVDITDRRATEQNVLKAKEAAEAANQAKSEFLANMSHEVRTPLNGMMGMLQLIMNTEDKFECDEMARVALESGKSLLAVLNDVLSLSQIEAGVVTLTNRTMDLAETGKNCTRLFELQARNQGLDLNYEVDGDLPPAVLGDESRLRQVLFNLMGNALKYTNRGSLTLGLAPLPHPTDSKKIRCLFQVRDTGIGIPAHLQRKIFEPFTQVDGSFTRPYQGAGLGLGIVRRLVTLMGGSVCLDSVEGEGTTVFFVLPFETSQPDEQDHHRETFGTPGRKLCVLLVEDDNVNRMVVKRFLDKAGHHTTQAVNGAEALEHASKDVFDVVLMDVQMPVLNGLEATRAIRALDGKNADVPILALTAHGMEGDRERFLDAGMDGYLAKPVEFGELLEELERVTGSGKAAPA